MKLENISDLYFVLSVFVPGFIYDGMLRQFVPLHSSTQKETIFLRLLTATAYNYALCAPIIYLCLYRGDLVGPYWRLAAWFGVIFIAPIAFAILRAMFLQTTKFDWIFRLLGLRPINPIPTGWDWIFSRTNPCFVLVTLTDGREIAGFFGDKSMASSDPERRDIFIEKLYKVPEDGTTWEPVSGNLGIQVDGTQIAFIEFRR
jgi:hypothetical protein